MCSSPYGRRTGLNTGRMGAAESRKTSAGSPLPPDAMSSDECQSSHQEHTKTVIIAQLLDPQAEIP
eukprot:1381024-Prymnesium_polylepis.1